MSNEIKLRMNAYYYGFERTGCLQIDRVLSAVACAGKAHHHTERWSDTDELHPLSEAGKIQSSATEAAQSFNKLIEIVQSVIEWNTKYPSQKIYNESSIRRIAAEMDEIFEKAKLVIADVTYRSDKALEGEE